MKRNCPAIDSEEFSLAEKKTKPSPKHANYLVKLSIDELYEILRFLSGRDILDLAFTSKINFDFVMEWAKCKYPFALQQSMNGTRIIIGYHKQDLKKKKKRPIYKTLKIDEMWKLERALKCHDFLLIGDDNYEIVFRTFTQIAEKYGGNLDFLTPCFKLKLVDNMEKLFDIPYQNYPISLPHVRIVRDGESYESVEDIKLETRQVIEKQIQFMPIGFKIKELWLDGCALKHLSLFRILGKCQSLESLVLSEIHEDRSYVDETDEHIDSGTRQFIDCPLLESLKRLQIISHYPEEFGHQFILDILKLTPNLEDFNCEFHTTCPNENEDKRGRIRHTLVDEDFLQYLSKMCPNLKAVDFDATFCDSNEPIEVSDQALYEFLKRQPKLEYISIYSYQITGEIFSKIGEFSQLQHISISRGESAITNTQAPQCDNLVFGGGVLMNLQSVNIDGYDLSEEEKAELRQSLYKIAPNFKSIDIFECDSD